MLSVHLEMSTQDDLNNATHPHVEHSISSHSNHILAIIKSIEERLKSIEVELRATKEIACDSQIQSKALYVATHTYTLSLLPGTLNNPYQDSTIRKREQSIPNLRDLRHLSLRL